MIIISSLPTGQDTTGTLYRSNYELGVLLFYQLFNKLYKYATSHLIQRNKRDDCQILNMNSGLAIQMQGWSGKSWGGGERRYLGVPC